MSETIEKTTIIKAKTGDEQALDALIRAYLPDVYNFSLRYMQNSFDAEEAVQETFVKIWKNIRKVDPEKNFKSWILEITKNTCLDLLKKKQIIPFSAFDSEGEENVLAATIPSGGQLPQDFAEQSLTRSWISKHVAKLAPQHRKVLTMYYEQDMNFREISEQLGEPLHTVKSRHRRAVIYLRKIIGLKD